MKYTLEFISTLTRRTISQVFFYGDSVIKSCEGTQQGDLESPVLFSDSIQDLIDSLESKINLWYLDDGNLSYDTTTVLKDLKKIVEAEKPLGLKFKPMKCESFSLVDITEKRRLTILTSFQKHCLGKKHQKKMNLSFLVHLTARNHKQTYWKRNSMICKMVMEFLKN